MGRGLVEPLETAVVSGRISLLKPGWAGHVVLLRVGTVIPSLKCRPVIEERKAQGIAHGDATWCTSSRLPCPSRGSVQPRRRTGVWRSGAADGRNSAGGSLCEPPALASCYGRDKVPDEWWSLRGRNRRGMGIPAS